MTGRDDALPAATHLLGDARPLLGVAFALEGATVRTCERRQVIHRPGRMLAVRYRVGIDDRAGRRRHHSIVAVADRSGPPEGTLVVEAGDDLSVGLFRFPHDPQLPGLPPLLDRDRAAELAGLPGPATVTVRTYRSMQRAVVLLTGTDGTTRYAKALPPAELAAAVHRHELPPAGVPAPRVHAAHPDLGLLVLDAVPGSSLRDRLRAGSSAPSRAGSGSSPTDSSLPGASSADSSLPGASSADSSSGGDVVSGAALPDPAELVEVLDRLGRVPASVPAGRRGPIPAAARHAVLLGRIVPGSRRRIARLLDRIGPDRPAPTRTIHGDLHPGQILTDGRAITGLIDLDDVGTGAAVDDLASFLGHLTCLVVDNAGPDARRFLAATLATFEAASDPAELHRRTAAVVLGLATGPYRVQQAGWEAATTRRLALAERWAAGDVRTLRTAS